ncbi:GTPase-activating Rap/Ran-GAP domain-like protein 3 [Araneus ventricosus]|uniref:GTPase-activating Rap/Ran-GAP domain-like protein 3 n=1 Tax=Araneus ventricosus TaxID=182803 RepID=A0A4Y2LNS2_ARAVE|nr:GTPase-activating Rap/Ran-GAP domain-like protein 3 [Araneus ventricosus]
MIREKSSLTLLDIFAVVSYEKEDDSYRLSVYSEESVPLFGPTLPNPPIFKNHQEFREFLLVKRKCTSGS